MKTAAERLAWALRICERSQIRLTPVRLAMAGFLAERRVPLTLESIAQGIRAGEACDATTVYRTLMMFKDAGLVRSVVGTRRPGLFVLNTSDDGGHFLTCERCGAVSEFEPPPAMLAAIQEAACGNGFAISGLKLEMRGLCPACEQSRRTSVGVSKLLNRSQAL